ncbi:hypothetical protein B0T16DRAFT_410985 [Cercophora newfieldiana]|uniref:Zn(2)-C6 fungal-type domain-containing protein n=1 Tax=Cercophora newfieldiana TaxID=92897 RepID=A0AA39YC86_9PEZI|nr:hypothetical protein B0T16DRAFT_410985 [Cercophora newfieldiana]
MQSIPPKRKFKFHSKTRTGCGTCKARKVKCDEAKPVCRRCASTGRHCDGYLSNSPSPAPGSSPSALVTATPSHLPLFDSSEEKRSFRYFQVQASKQLGGSFHGSFWGREVMQAAIHHPPIRHLVVALGAAYEASEAGLGLHCEKVEFALQQCNRSIQHLTTQARAQTVGGGQSPENVSTLLAASILFIHFAHVRGHNTEAFQHIRSAIKVLRDFEASTGTSAGSSPRSPGRCAFPVPLAQLRAMLISAYGQLRNIVEDTVIGVEEAEDMLTTNMKPAALFFSAAEAHQYVENLFYNTLAFLQHSHLHSPHSAATPERFREVTSRYRELCHLLESSKHALDALVASIAQQPDQLQDVQVENGIILLQVYHIVLTIWLRIDALQPDRRESAFDALEADLEKILTLCERFVENDARVQQPSHVSSMRCSSGLGCVMPLHTVSVRCRSPELRKRAINALIKCSRRDGLWDSYITARVAAETVQIAEQFMYATGVYSPKQPKTTAQQIGTVKELKFELRNDRSALLRFIIVGGDEIQKTIRW